MREKINNWADNFLKSEVELMDKDTSEAFIQCSLGIPPNVSMQEIAEHPAATSSVKIIVGRGAAIGLEMNAQATVFMSVLCKGRPGTMVMWVNALRSWQIRNNNQRIDMNVLGMQLFPNGFPTENALQAAWEAQKTEDGFNLLDRYNAQIHEEKTNGADGQDT